MAEIHELFRNEPTLYAVVILVGSVVAAFIVNLLTVHVLVRLTMKTRTDLDDQIVDALRKPLFLSVILLGVSVALGRLGISEGGHDVGNKVLWTLAILLWTGAGIRIGNTILSALSKRVKQNKVVQPRTLPLFEILVKTLVFGGAAYGVLVAWHVDVTAWLASAGILGIALGFAAKDTLSNFFSGIFILADAPYKLGDFVVLETGERGVVTDIGIRSTRLLTRDDIQIIVPNATIANAKIVNETGGPHEKERVRVRVGVAYGSDIEQVRRILLAVAEGCEYVDKSPEPRVRFRRFGDSALEFELLGWIAEPVLRGRALDSLNRAVYKHFHEAQIRIPFPQRDVHLRKE